MADHQRTYPLPLKQRLKRSLKELQEAKQAAQQEQDEQEEQELPPPPCHSGPKQVRGHEAS